MNRGLPPLDLRPRWSHLLILVDLALIAGIFHFAQDVYFNTKGAERLRASETERQARKDEAERLSQEADSVLAVAKTSLVVAQSDSLRMSQELANRLADLDALVADQQRLAQSILPVSEDVLEQRSASAAALRRVDNQGEALKKRQVTVAGLRTDLLAATRKLDDTRELTASSLMDLESARRKRDWDPVGILPSRSGMLLSHEFSDDVDHTIVELQHKLANAGKLDLGLAAGVGFAAGGGSMKQVGVLLTQLLVHRRVSLDASAGYNVLTDDRGDDEGGAYGALGFRFSPFYREHFHLGLGARAAREGVMPYLGIGIGRR